MSQTTPEPRLRLVNPDAAEPAGEPAYDELEKEWTEICQLATMAFAMGQHKRAKTEMLKALELAERFGAADEYGSVTTTLRILADICCDMKRFEEAEEYVRRAIEIDRQTKRLDELFDPSLASDHIKLAVIFTETNRLKEAEELFQSALAVFDTLPEDFDAIKVDAWHGYAQFLRKAKRTKEAKAWEKKANQLMKVNEGAMLDQLMDFFGGAKL
jgi:tetratricopeptide (TPR) repeat protein